MEKEQLYDVLVFENSTKEIVAFIGRGLKLGGGRNSAESRYASQADRIDDTKYTIDIVETGVFTKKGEIYK